MEIGKFQNGCNPAQHTLTHTQTCIRLKIHHRAAVLFLAAERNSAFNNKYFYIKVNQTAKIHTDISTYICMYEIV